MKSKFISVILSMAVILGLILVPAVTSPVLADPATDWGFEMDPAMVQKGYSQSFSVDANVVRYSGDSASYVMYVLFNATLLNVTGVTFPALLPNGAAPFMTSSSWDNAAGWVKAEYAKTPATPDINQSFTFCTIDFDTLNVEGVSGLNFIWIDAIKATEVQLGGIDHLNWTTVVNGTVMVGAPKLVLDVQPRGWPPYPMATGGMAIGYNIPPDPADLPAWLANPDFLMVYPNATFPNTTTWSWNEVLIIGAVEFVPGWEFSHWVGDPGYGDLGPLDLLGYTVWGRTLVLSPPSTSLQANFTMKAPVVNVTPASLAFSPFEGINPASQNLTIRNTGGGLLSWTLTDDANYTGHDWLSAAPASGNLVTNFVMPENVTVVSVNVSGMPQGDYACVINVTGSTTQLIPVNLTIRPATAIDVCRNIVVSGDSGKPGETDELYPGETFDVYVNFTAPPTNPNHGFNAIGITDLAPDGWTVQVDKNWSWINGSQEAAYAVDDSTDNVAQIMWTGPYDEGTNISGMYKVTVPTTADPGLNTWPTCDDDGMADAWVEYYFNDEGPHMSPICCDREVVVTQPGDIEGETRDVNANELADVDVQLHLNGDGYLWSDISTPDYTLTAWVTGEYWLVVNRTRYHQINASDVVDVPGIAVTIDFGTPELLAAGHVFDFEGNFGLVPRACALSYVLRTVNLWKIGYPGHSEWTITEEWKVGDVINSWLYPS